MAENPIQNIVFDDIDETYCYGKFANFKVIMNKSTGYINATKMCQSISEQTGSKKPFRHWILIPPLNY
jgi:hypothetical protein